VRKLLAVLTAFAVLIAGAAFAYQHHREVQREKDRREAMAAASAFLATWQAKRYDDLGPMTAADPDAGASFRLLATRLKASSLTLKPGAFTKDGRHLSYSVDAVLSGLGALSWANTLDMTKTSRGFRVQFRSGTVFPGLVNGQVLTRSEPLLSRGDLVDRHGTTIRGNDADLTANVLGSLAGDKTGLERVYDTQLTGSSGGNVQVVDRRTGSVVRLVKSFPAKKAAPVTTTLDLPMQKAAEAALARVNGKAAMVVLDTATGEIRAVANLPVAGLPAAFHSEAPGSTFKILVAAAALQHGFTPASVVKCPASAVFGGKRFVNDEPLPATMTLATAFARSCNTAFLNVADTFPKGTLRALAPTFGFDRGPLLDTGAEGGSVPAPDSTTEAYADVIGQGRVEASPLLMATVSAAVASGTWRKPHLVTGPTTGVPLPAGVLPGLRQLMAGVVTSGTAATAGLPAGTRGKTGTAEFGTGTPLPTHAWFTGYRRSLALCVYVENGDTGGRTAAPVAAAFLRSFGG
jgi:cell division protein FtsI/penicillin-binding protein 2